MKFSVFFARTCLLLAFLSIIVMPVTVLAQSVGSIGGTVTDGAGKPLGKVRVAVTGPVTRASTTKDDGTFAITVPVGIYSLAISAPGFQSVRNDSIVVTAGQNVVITTALVTA